jgi:hypothetical protein
LLVNRYLKDICSHCLVGGIENETLTKLVAFALVDRPIW